MFLNDAWSLILPLWHFRVKLPAPDAGRQHWLRGEDPARSPGVGDGGGGGRGGTITNATLSPPECEPVWQKDLGSKPLRFWFLFKSCGLWTLSCDFVPHNYETLKWLSSLPSLMQKSFWWWQCSDRYIISLSLSLHLRTPTPHLLPVPNKPYD